MGEFNRHVARFDAFRATPMMTQRDVKEVAAAYEVGAHSFNHATMTMESDGYLRADVARCSEYFRTSLGLGLEIYAFPNGVARRGQTEIVREEGVTDVLLTGLEFADSPPWLHSRRLVYGGSRHEARFRAVGSFQPRPPKMVVEHAAS